MAAAVLNGEAALTLEQIRCLQTLRDLPTTQDPEMRNALIRVVRAHAQANPAFANLVRATAEFPIDFDAVFEPDNEGQ